MKWLFVILCLVLLLLILVLFSQVKIFLNYYHGNDNDEFQLVVRGLWGLFRYKLKIPVLQMDKDSPELVVKKEVEKDTTEKSVREQTERYTAEDMVKGIKDIKTLLKHVSGFYKVVRWFLRKVSVEEFEWHSRVGADDAAYTGMIAGALWTAKGSLVGLISVLMRLKKMPEITVTPFFEGAITQTSLKCMIRFRFGNAIFAGMKLFKLWRGGKADFQTKPLSTFFKGKTKTY